jgi:nitrite reductase/ring-hydroxylating ferredoxin subunit
MNGCASESVSRNMTREGPSTAREQWLCALETLPDGGCTELSCASGEGEGTLAILLYRSGLEVKAFVNCCPHFSLPLNSRPGEFLLMSGAQIMCAHHCAVFRLQDGQCVDGPGGKTALEAVRVEIRDGQVFVCASTPEHRPMRQPEGQ